MNELPETTLLRRWSEICTFATQINSLHCRSLVRASNSLPVKCCYSPQDPQRSTFATWSIRNTPPIDQRQPTTSGPICLLEMTDWGAICYRLQWSCWQLQEGERPIRVFLSVWMELKTKFTLVVPVQTKSHSKQHYRHTDNYLATHQVVVAGYYQLHTYSRRLSAVSIDKLVHVSDTPLCLNSADNDHKWKRLG